MYGTRATLVQIAGVLITTVGVVVVATQGAPLSILEIGFNRGDLAMLAACVLYAFYTWPCATGRTCRASPSSRCWR